MKIKKNPPFLIVVVFLISSLFLTSYTSETPFNLIDETINQSQLSKNSIVSVSIRDIQSENLIYQRYANLLLHPASTLKAFTKDIQGG